LLDVFGSRWDTGFYLSIADEGYRYQGVDLPSVAFFPLLPLLIRAVTPLTGDSLTAGLLVTNLALLAAVIFLYRLVEMEWGRETAAGQPGICLSSPLLSLARQYTPNPFFY
jgi:Gpi18-like mannosyltransferase